MEHLKPKIEPLRMVIFDVDGVMTDGRIIIDNNGVESKFFNVSDGQGVKWLGRAGIESAIITGRQSRVVEVRAAELGVTRVIQGAKFKGQAYDQLLSETGLSEVETAYMGDDLIDLPVLRRAGLALAPADARPEVLEIVDWAAPEPGGRGAVRSACELILKLKGQWEEVTKRYY